MLLEKVLLLIISFLSLFTVTVVPRVHKHTHFFPHAEIRVGVERRRAVLELEAWRSYSAAGVAAGHAVVPVAAQVDLQSQQAIGGGTILTTLIWDTVHTWWSSCEDFKTFKSKSRSRLKKSCGQYCFRSLTLLFLKQKPFSFVKPENLLNLGLHRKHFSRVVYFSHARLMEQIHFYFNLSTEESNSCVSHG